MNDFARSVGDNSIEQIFEKKFSNEVMTESKNKNTFIPYYPYS